MEENNVALLEDEPNSVEEFRDLTENEGHLPEADRTVNVPVLRVCADSPAETLLVELCDQEGNHTISTDERKDAEEQIPEGDRPSEAETLPLFHLQR